MKSNKILAAIAVSTVLLVGGKSVYAHIIDNQVHKNELKTESVAEVQKQDAKGKTNLISDGEVNLAITQYTKEEVAGNNVIEGAIEKINNYFPETKDFEIASVQTNKGTVTGQEMNYTSVELKEKGGASKELNFGIDATTGNLISIQQVNWKATDKSIATLKKEEIKERADEVLTKLGVDIKEYKCELDNTSLEKEAKEIKGVEYAAGDKRLNVRYTQTKDEKGKAFLVYFANDNICVQFIEHANEYNFGSEFKPMN